MDNPTIKNVYNKLGETNTKLDKVIIGLYGQLDDPGSGFITKTNDRLNTLEEFKTARKWLFKTILGTIIIAVVGILFAVAKGYCGI